MRLLLIVLLSFLHPSQDRTVYVCTGPKAYAWHLDASCSGLNRCSAAIVKMSQADAEKQRRTPCRHCVGGSLVPVKAKDAAANDGQCRATTKKGTRCSRSARSGGYCWQHGG